MRNDMNSAERYYRYTFFIILAVTFAMAAVTALPFLFIEEDSLIGGITCAAVTAVIIPFLIYYLVQYLHYKNAELEDVGEAKLVRTHTNSFRMIGFIAELQQDGQTREVTTKHVFNAAKYGPNLLDDYCGKTVRWGYERGRNEYIVL